MDLFQPPTDGYTPPDALDREEALLAPYAMRTRLSQGRRHPEAEHAYRTPYQRDRDRIVHSAAFRRLMYKTQVLVNDYGDEHRTRLTHTLEVAQISRTLARQLGLNEDLTEAIALAHDLGHPPFGHAGEYALDDCMKDHGGYEHNRFGLRLVELLETRYPGFPGLNLTREVRESMAYHSKRPESPELREYLITGQPFLEAQIVDAADSLAYDCHDLDDALSARLITFSDLHAVELCRHGLERLKTRYGQLAEEELRPALVRGLIDLQVNDLLHHTRANIAVHRIRSVDDVRRAPALLALQSPELHPLKGELEAFLHQRVYQHFEVTRMTTKAQRIISGLFAEFQRTPGALPPHWQGRSEAGGLEQTICDYLASMTDRAAQEEYRKLFHPVKSV